jgi:hypothetical protein
VIHYLCSDHTPTARQTEPGVALLADQLQDHGLTKAEVLQLCNLAPTLPVELYCVSGGAELFHTFTNARLSALLRGFISRSSSEREIGIRERAKWRMPIKI